MLSHLTSLSFTYSFLYVLSLRLHYNKSVFLFSMCVYLFENNVRKRRKRSETEIQTERKRWNILPSDLKSNACHTDMVKPQRGGWQTIWNSQMGAKCASTRAVFSCFLRCNSRELTYKYRNRNCHSAIMALQVAP